MQDDAADAVTKHRIAIEIPYSFIVDTTERDTPIELQGERDITIAESLRAGTRTHDALPLARRKPGEQTDVWYVGGLKSLSAVGGSQSAEPVQTCRRGHVMTSIETYVRDTCDECGVLIEMGNRVFECKSCYPTWWRCSE